jgi:hypothetical protein
MNVVDDTESLATMAAVTRDLVDAVKRWRSATSVRERVAALDAATPASVELEVWIRNRAQLGRYEAPTADADALDFCRTAERLWTEIAEVEAARKGAPATKRAGARAAMAAARQAARWAELAADIEPAVMARRARKTEVA